ncbi:MAG: pantothenate kinase [Candidatus Cloacimonadota bacterium]|nr:MAG: pantothenate kinase [Candidatus Cloacimonadota bacterium]
MNFVIDIGNSNIVLAIYNEDELRFHWRIETVKLETAESYYHKINTLFSKEQIAFNAISRIALSSVVPQLTETFNNLFAQFFDCPKIIVTASSKLGLTYPVSNPDYIGSDLIVNAYAAWQKYNKNCIICDLGTATTIQLVGKNGFYHGYIIAPGVNISLQALFSLTSQLPETVLTEPDNLLGNNTKDAMMSGIVTGNRLALAGFIREIKKEYQHIGETYVIATGGIAEVICNNSNEVDVIDNYLLIDGLNLICRNIDF